MANYLTTEVNDRKQLGECVKETVSHTGIKPKEAVADKGYGNFKDTFSLQDQGVECFVPLQKKRMTIKKSRDWFLPL